MLLLSVSVRQDIVPSREISHLTTVRKAGSTWWCILQERRERSDSEDGSHFSTSTHRTRICPVSRTPNTFSSRLKSSETWSHFSTTTIERGSILFQVILCLHYLKKKIIIYISVKGTSAARGIPYMASLTMSLGMSCVRPKNAVYQAANNVTREAHLCNNRMVLLVLSIPKSGCRKTPPANPNPTQLIITPIPHQACDDFKWSNPLSSLLR